MVKRSAKHTKRSEIAKRLRKEGVMGKKLTDNVFKRKFYPRTGLKIVLDLDRTLWALHGKHHLCEIEPRPYAIEFVNLCSKIAEKVIFFTGASLDPTLKKLERFNGIPPIPLLTYEDLVRADVKGVKGNFIVEWDYEALFKAVPDFDAGNTLIVDDVPDYYMAPHKENVLKISAYKGQSANNPQAEDALLLLGNFLLTLRKKRKESIRELLEKFTKTNEGAFHDFDRSSAFRIEWTHHGWKVSPN